MLIILIVILSIGVVILSVLVGKNKGAKTITNVIKFLSFPLSMYALGLSNNSNSNVVSIIAICIVPIAVYLSATLVADKIISKEKDNKSMSN